MASRTQRACKRIGRRLLAGVAIGVAGFGARVLGPLVCRRPTGEPIRRILVVRLDLLGDLALSMPAVWALHRGYPNARIDLATLPYTAPLLAHYPFVGKVWRFDVNRLRPSGRLFDLRQYLVLVRILLAIRRERYDLVLSLHGAWASVFAIASGAPIRIGFAGESVPHTLTLGVPGRRYRVRRHEAEYCLDLAREAGGLVDVDSPHLRPLPDAAARVDELLAREGVRADDLLVALHAGATNGSAKRWPAGSCAALATRLIAEHGARVVLTGSAGERDLAEAVATASAAIGGEDPGGPVTGGPGAEAPTTNPGAASFVAGAPELRGAAQGD
ncbi:MAG: glycosyltransferase family 9 protein, partial [Chloroflexi bacterium]|nr:glycosyltransferase family 9 protein [Chloroflexota bacterium]